MTAGVEDGAFAVKIILEEYIFKGNLVQFCSCSLVLPSCPDGRFRLLCGVMGPTAQSCTMGQITPHCSTRITKWKWMAISFQQVGIRWNNLKLIYIFFLLNVIEPKINTFKKWLLDISVTFTQGTGHGDEWGRLGKNPAARPRSGRRGRWMWPSNPAGGLIQVLWGAVGNTLAWQETLN